MVLLIYMYNMYKIYRYIYLFLYRASEPFGVSSETYMLKQRNKKEGF